MGNNQAVFQRQQEFTEDFVSDQENPNKNAYASFKHEVQACLDFFRLHEATRRNWELRESYLLEKGQTDQTTVTPVSVMVYYTPDFKKYAMYPTYFIKKQIQFANRVMYENEIPVKFNICDIEELEGFEEDPDSVKRLYEFTNAKRNLLNTADIGILMTGTPAKDQISGIAFPGPSRKDQFAWVHPRKGLCFLHEVGHIFGCQHNREELNGGNRKESNYGFHIKGSNMTTIMAYQNKTHIKHIARFSSKDHTYKGLPLGNAKNDNRGQIIKTRFLVSQRSWKCEQFTIPRYPKGPLPILSMYTMYTGNWFKRPFDDLKQKTLTLPETCHGRSSESANAVAHSTRPVSFPSSAVISCPFSS